MMMMMMNEGDKQIANVDYDDNDWRRHVLFYEWKWLNLYQYYNNYSIIFIIKLNKWYMGDR